MKGFKIKMQHTNLEFGIGVRNEREREKDLFGFGEDARSERHDRGAMRSVSTVKVENLGFDVAKQSRGGERKGAIE